MKLVFSFIFLSTLSSQAVGAPIQIFYEKDSTRATWVKEIFVKNYHVPEDLIKLKETAKCEGLKVRGKLDLCLNNNGDLLIVSVDREFISESLKIFQTP